MCAKLRVENLLGYGSIHWGWANASKIIKVGFYCIINPRRDEMIIEKITGVFLNPKGVKYFIPLGFVV